MENKKNEKLTDVNDSDEAKKAEELKVDVRRVKQIRTGVRGGWAAEQ